MLGDKYAATGPIFDLPDGISVVSKSMTIEHGFSVHQSCVFKSSVRQTMRFSFVMPVTPVDGFIIPIARLTDDMANVSGLVDDKKPAN